ncbi:tRNA lysidine(34) synthetase TilS [Thermoflexus sp.]|uniref:tRNA lysidine(34) synthetase TilS n=1 Tax=Thermoflexus sp. TaxID=1969742 RepID=UPI0035E440C1
MLVQAIAMTVEQRVVARVRQVVREAAHRFQLFPPGETVIVGVSGGPDSLCLLDVLRDLASEFGIALHVAHLHHGLRGLEADADAAFVAELAQAWGLPFTIGKEDVRALAAREGVSLEEAARQARYTFLAEVAARVGSRTIAVAHHADDQVETVLMHLLRGSGLAGLRGMRPRMLLTEYHGLLRRPPEGLWLVRPLLGVWRREIEAYLQAKGLTPRFDRSNLDLTFFRNRLRHEVLPFLERLNPRLRETWRRMAEILAADYEFLEGTLRQVWPTVLASEEPERIVFDLARWRELPLSLKRMALREAAFRLAHRLRDLGFEHVEEAIRMAEEGMTGGMLTWPEGLQVVIAYGNLIVAREGAAWPEPDLPLLAHPLPLEPGETRWPDGRWVVIWEEIFPWDPNRLQHTDLWTLYLDPERSGTRLSFRVRRPGDRFHPAGMPGPVRLKTFLINRKIPQAWRDRWPLLVNERDEILWVAGIRPAAFIRPGPDSRRVWRIAIRRAT